MGYQKSMKRLSLLPFYQSTTKALVVHVIPLYVHIISPSLIFVLKYVHFWDIIIKIKVTSVFLLMVSGTSRDMWSLMNNFFLSLFQIILSYKHKTDLHTFHF